MNSLKINTVEPAANTILIQEADDKWHKNKSIIIILILILLLLLMSGKFVSKTILTSEDGLEFHEVARDQPIRIDEKKVHFMTLQEQIVEQEKLDSQAKE